MANPEITEKYEDVLQNLEFPIITIYRHQPDLIDAEALTAIEALIRIYGAEAQGKAIGTRPVRGIAKSVMEAVQQMCELRLGRASLPEGDQPMPDVPAITVSELVECLKQIQSSIKFWSRERGRQGYLSYVNNFIV
jgi:hypothetical protein